MFSEEIEKCNICVFKGRIGKEKGRKRRKIASFEDSRVHSAAENMNLAVRNKKKLLKHLPCLCVSDETVSSSVKVVVLNSKVNMHASSRIVFDAESWKMQNLIVVIRFWN